MSSWLGGFSKKNGDEAESKTNDISEHSDKDKDCQESKTDTPTSQKSVKGSLDGRDDASSVTGGADSSVASGELSPGDEKTPLAGGVSDKLNQGAKSFGSFLSSAFNKAGKTVSEAGTKIKKSVAENSVLADFYRDNEAFSSSMRKNGPAPPPWSGHAQEAALREQILSLSTEKRNFVRCPPAGVQFQFDMETYLPVAAAILKEDTELQKIRYELVPKVVSEESFWRNYFYRVSLVKQSCELSAMAQEGQVRSNDSSPVSSSPDPVSPGDDDARPDSPEFLSDGLKPSSRDLEEVRDGVRQLGVNKNDEQWERQLAAELLDYELVAEGTSETATGKTTSSSSTDWEKDMERMLKEEHSETVSQPDTALSLSDCDDLK